MSWLVVHVHTPMKVAPSLHLVQSTQEMVRHLFNTPSGVVLPAVTPLNPELHTTTQKKHLPRFSGMKFVLC